MDNAINQGQMKRIYAMGREGGMDNDALHSVVYTVTGKSSIKALSWREAFQVIDRLKSLTGQEDTGPHDRASSAEIAKLYALSRKLGWADDPRRLTAWLEKRYDVSHPRFLTDTNARNCIEAMKAMLAGGRGERKGGGCEQVDGRAGP